MIIIECATTTRKKSTSLTSTMSPKIDTDLTTREINIGTMEIMKEKSIEVTRSINEINVLHLMLAVRVVKRA